MGTVATCWGLKEVRAGISSQCPGLLEYGHGILVSVDKRSKPQIGWHWYLMSQGAFSIHLVRIKHLGLCLGPQVQVGRSLAL